MTHAPGSVVSHEDLHTLAPALVPYVGAVYVEAARAPGPRGEAWESRFGERGATVFVWLEASVLPERARARLTATDGWVVERADAARSQVRNRATALRALETRVKLALEGGTDAV